MHLCSLCDRGRWEDQGLPPSFGDGRGPSASGIIGTGDSRGAALFPSMPKSDSPVLDNSFAYPMKEAAKSPLCSLLNELDLLN